MAGHHLAQGVRGPGGRRRLRAPAERGPGPAGGPQIGKGVGIVGKTIIRHGSEKLKREFLPKILRNEVEFANMLRKTVTENYPEEPVHFQPRYRGIHVLHRDESGLEKCVGCFLCAAACPARCIYIEAAENTDAQRISAGERYARVYNIDYSRCIFCGYCVEACPTDAITHGHGFELATSNINAMIYRKEKLLEKTPTAP